jgi:hypothetical protein
MSQKGKPMPLNIPEKKTELRHIMYTLDGKEHIISPEDYATLKSILSNKDELYRSMHGSVIANEGTDSETIVLMQNLCAVGKKQEEV